MKRLSDEPVKYIHVVQRPWEPATLAVVVVNTRDRGHVKPEYTLEMFRKMVADWREAEPENAEEFIEYDTLGDFNIGDIISFDMMGVLQPFLPEHTSVCVEPVDNNSQWIYDSKLM